MTNIRTNETFVNHLGKWPLVGNPDRSWWHSPQPKTPWKAGSKFTYGTSPIFLDKISQIMN